MTVRVFFPPPIFVVEHLHNLVRMETGGREICGDNVDDLRSFDAWTGSVQSSNSLKNSDFFPVVAFIRIFWILHCAVIQCAVMLR